MCICFFGTNLRPGLAFLLCFNRDEFLSRPTAPVHFWTGDQGHVLAGRDLTAGGTWLGLSLAGRVSFLTNLRAAGPIHYRQQAPTEPGQDTAVSCFCHSRGELTTQFLNSDLSPLEYCQALDLTMYHGFNLVCVDVNNLTAAYTNNAAHAPGVMAAPATHAPAGAASTCPTGTAGTMGAAAVIDAGTGSTVAATQTTHAAAVDTGAGSAVAIAVPGKQPTAVSDGLPASHVSAPLTVSETAGSALPSQLHGGMEAPAHGGQVSTQQRLQEGLHAVLPQTQQGSQPGLWEAAGDSTSATSSAAVAAPTTGNVSAAQPLQAGKLYGLSNGRLNEWPKVKAGMEYFTELLQKDNLWEDHQLPFDDLFEELLGNCSRQEQLQPTDPATGHPLSYSSLSLEQHLEYITSSRFVEAVSSKFGLYGTRSQTIVAVWDDGVVQVQERNLVQEDNINTPDLQDPTVNHHHSSHQASTPATSTSLPPEDNVATAGNEDVATSTQGTCSASSAAQTQTDSAVETHCRRVSGPGWVWRTTRHTLSLKQLGHQQHT